MKCLLKSSIATLSLAGALFSGAADGLAASLPPQAFGWGPNPVTATAGGWWFDTWNGSLGNNRMIGPEGMDVFAVSNQPFQDVVNADDANIGVSRSEITITTILNVENVAKDGTNRIVYQFGGLRSKAGPTAAMLLYMRDGDLYYVAAGRKGDNDLWATPEQLDNPDPYNGDKAHAYIVREGIGPGYHLITATYSYTSQKLTLRIDDEDLMESESGRVVPEIKVTAENEKNKISFYLGNTSAGPAPGFKTGNNAAFDRVIAWEQILTEEQQLELWNTYKDLIRNENNEPMITPSYLSGYNVAGGTLFVPSLSARSQNDIADRLEFASGTMNIPATANVTVPFVHVGGNTANGYTVNIDGTLNVTGTSPKYSFYNSNNTDQYLKGILFGDSNGSATAPTGTGTVNITGKLTAPLCWLQPNNARTSTDLNINGGEVKVYGLYGRNMSNNDNYSNVTLTGGGLLELAEIYASGLVHFFLGEGTFRVIPQTEGANPRDKNSPGLVFQDNRTPPYGMPIQFTDKEVGTTLDPNGRQFSFWQSDVTGGGKVIVNDTSAAANGVVSFADVNSLEVGDIEVLSGTLALGTALDASSIKFATGATLDVRTVNGEFNFGDCELAPVTEAGAKVTLKTAVAIADGAKLLSWNKRPEKLNFVLEGENALKLVKRDDGLYVSAVGGMMIIVE